ncbi:MAG: response regulator [Candidatus Rokubacteria bacterium]|nr:response regulator [Candidatus Rokubacteria bacterium]MBI2014496.1 response regulator [Candidatus Rokubacteria bacterium]MBI2157005.1 response regulator [Candidatus Rokubacteria bacterium]MBI2494041.1 response regulator [Candidatus Rokubacteria bacterium]MBI4629769.1 response regulator [Candidatus Rokubacteria bacterium]
MAQRDILIVDDDRQVRDVLHQIFLSAGYNCLLANDGREGLEVFRAARPPLTVTDLKMPAMTGIELLQKVRETDGDAAVIVLTGAADVKTAIDSLKLGAYDFIMKPVNVDELLIAAERALERRQLLIERREYHELLERRVVEATRDLASAYKELQETYRSTLEALGSALDTRDVGTEAHSRRVHGYALATAREHGVAERDQPDLAHGVLLHDIGKIGIPDAILLKPGPLTPEEWTIMRRHPEIGRALIEKIPFLRGAVPIVWSHHEKWDGTGYPRGLKGAEIPLGARIFMVVDAFDAMTFDRPYSKAKPVDVAKAEIRRCAGTHFDPVVVESFFRVPEALLEEIRRRSVEP